MGFDRQLVEAQIALDMIPSAEMPKIALDAMEAGVDGSATLRLAVLEKPTFFEVREILPAAMDEMKLTRIEKSIAAKRIAKSWATNILNSGDDPLRYLRNFEHLWIAPDTRRKSRL